MDRSPSESGTQLSTPGDSSELFAQVYAHLRDIAHAQLRRDARGRDGVHTLSTTALVHEAYFKLAEPSSMNVQDRAHFLMIAARAMRQVLIEYARKYRAEKRGGPARVQLNLDSTQLAVESRADMLLALDEALVRLTAMNSRLARVVELRYFGGLAEPEVAELLGVTDRTVRRDWVKARAWLHAELNDA